MATIAALRKEFRKGVKVSTPGGTGVTTSFQFTAVPNRGPVCATHGFEHFATIVVKLDKPVKRGILCRVGGGVSCSGCFNCVCCDNNIAWFPIDTVQRIA